MTDVDTMSDVTAINKKLSETYILITEGSMNEKKAITHLISVLCGDVADKCQYLHGAFHSLFVLMVKRLSD